MPVISPVCRLRTANLPAGRQAGDWRLELYILPFFVEEPFLTPGSLAASLSF
jgi:hypothetical protein